MKKVNFALCFVFALAFFVASVQAATVISPASSSTIAGTAVVLNASQTTLNGLVNCTFYSQSSSTANSSWPQIGFIANISANMSSLNMTFNSNVLEDSNNYIFNATCRNSANAQSTQATTTSVTIDNTVPATPTSASPANNVRNATIGAKTFSATVTDGQTTGCSLIIAKDSPNLDDSTKYGYAVSAGTQSASNCTATRTFTYNELGRWYWRIQANDGTNYTNNSINLITIERDTQGRAQPAPIARRPSIFTRIRDFFRRLFR